MYYYVVNPSSSRATKGVQDKVRARLTALGIGGEFAKTTGPGDAAQLTEAAIKKGYNTIVAMGGDGTVNEVVNSVTGATAAIGIIPLGNSNKIAHRLGIINWQQACDVLAARRLSDFSLIAAGQNYFLSTLTLGFETDLDKRVDMIETGLKARLLQIRHSWDQAKHFTPLNCQITADNNLEIAAEVFTLSVTNQKFEDPLATNKLIVSWSEKPSRKQLTSYIWQILKGAEPLAEAATTRFSAKRVMINTEPVTGITVDGKLAGRTPIAIRLTDRRIRFITEKQIGNLNLKSQL